MGDIPRANSGPSPWSFPAGAGILDRMRIRHKKYLLLPLLFLMLACARREEKDVIITTTKPDLAPNNAIISDVKPQREGGTVIMATAPGATPPPSQPSPVPAVPPPSTTSLTTTTTTGVTAVTAPVGEIAVAATVPVKPPPTAVEVGTVSVPEKVGLLECDTFVDRYTSCINRNVPLNQQGPMIRGLESDVKRWQAMMGTATGRTDAANDCQRAFDRTKQAMTAYSCAWE